MISQPTTEVRGAIRVVIEKFMDAYNKGDAAGIASLYTEDAQLLLTNSDFINGKKAIQEFWHTRIDPGNKSVKLETIEIEEHGNTSIEVGLYSVQTQNNQTLDRGKYIVIWKLEKGQWRLYRDMMNSSLPLNK